MRVQGWVFAIGFSLMLSASVFAAGSVVKIDILGMVCPLCSRGLQKGFKGVDAVDQVVVDMDKQKVTLKLKEGQSIDDATIKRVVEDAGVNVKSIER